MTESVTQLALRLTPQAVYHFSNYHFFQPEIAAALADLQSHQADFIFLAAEAAVGKTHLLIALNERVQRAENFSLYLSFKELMQTAQPDILHNIESNQLVCFDDVDVIIGHFEWEEALFHCFNRLKQLGRQIVMAAKYNPASLAFALPDLGSRLATSLVFQLPDMTDEDKQQALIKQAKFKGLELDDATALYLLRHCGRDMHTLIAILDKLDKASLRAQRRLTIPFIRDVTSES